jgi:hypothetical protein
VATAKNENLKPDMETIGKSRVPAQEKQRGQLTLLDEARWGKLTIERKESWKPGGGRENARNRRGKGIGFPPFPHFFLERPRKGWGTDAVLAC